MSYGTVAFRTLLLGGLIGAGPAFAEHNQSYRIRVASEVFRGWRGEGATSDTWVFRQLGALCGLPCSLTSCCDLSGESPDDGRFPV
jgi:hypothetical protein